LNAVDLDDCTYPIGTQVMGLFGAEANALGVLGAGFFPMAATKPEIGEFGIQLGASWIEIEFTLNERYGSVFKMQLQPEVGGLHNDARSQFGFARQEPTLRLFECSQRQIGVVAVCVDLRNSNLRTGLLARVKRALDGPAVHGQGCNRLVDGKQGISTVEHEVGLFNGRIRCHRLRSLVVCGSRESPCNPKTSGEQQYGRPSVGS
jgi:hypothetical protein